MNSKYWKLSLSPLDPEENDFSERAKEEQVRNNNNNKNNNLQQLVEVYPELAGTVFDNCCSTTTDQHTQEKHNTFLVGYLDPLYTTKGIYSHCIILTIVKILIAITTS